MPPPQISLQCKNYTHNSFQVLDISLQRYNVLAYQLLTSVRGVHKVRTHNVCVHASQATVELHFGSVTSTATWNAS